MDLKIRRYLSQIGSRGGKKSKRSLSPETAKKMVRLREARRAYIKYHAQCFWSFDPEYIIGVNDLEWVSNQLIKNGNSELWKLGKKICP